MPEAKAEKTRASHSYLGGQFCVDRDAPLLEHGENAE